MVKYLALICLIVLSWQYSFATLTTKEFIKKNPCSVIMFYYQSCKFCNEIYREYDNLKMLLLAHIPLIKFTKVKIENTTSTKAEPIFILYKNQKEHVFQLDLCNSNAIAMAKKLMNEITLVMPVDTIEYAEKMKKLESFVFAYFPSGSQLEKAAYHKASTELRIPIFESSKEEIRDLFNDVIDTNSSIYAFEKVNGKANVTKYSEDKTDSKKIKEFILIFGHKSVTEYTEEFRISYNDSVLHYIFLIANKFDPAYPNQKADYIKVAENYRKEALFFTFDAKHLKHSYTMKILGVKKDDLPALRSWNIHDKDKSYKPETSNITFAAIENFTKFVVNKDKQSESISSKKGNGTTI